MLKLIVLAGGLLAALGSFLASTAGLLPFGNQPYQVTAHFLSAEGVTPGNDVLISGVPVGKVASVAVAPESDAGGGALIVLEINRQYAPLRSGTQATIRQKGFLGNMFIELQPGTDGNRAIPTHGTLPLQDTASPVSLDEVMDIFDPNTREKVKQLTLEGGKTFADNRGQDLNTFLAALPEVSSNLNSATAALDTQQRQLEALTVEFDRIAADIAAEERALRADLHNGAELLTTLAAHQKKLQDEIVFAAKALAAFNAGLTGHEQDLNTLLKEMPALQQHLKALSNTVDPALVDVNYCIGDILNAVSGLRSSTAYAHPGGATDGNGYMLRVNTNVNPPAGASSGSLAPPTATCAGGVPTK